MNRQEIETVLKQAFAGVTLGNGISLRQAESIDTYGQIPPDDRDPEANIIDDWQSIPFRELERDCIAHLDAEGLRYYLPALALALLDCYDYCEMWVIGTLSALDPQQDFWSYHMYRYSLLDRKKLEGELIALWKSPFNKENREQFGQPFKRYGT